MTIADTQRSKWLALALLAAAQFVVVLDASIVNVTLPSIGRALNFTQEHLSEVLMPYPLHIGGCDPGAAPVAREARPAHEELLRRRRRHSDLRPPAARLLAGGRQPGGLGHGEDDRPRRRGAGAASRVRGDRAAQPRAARAV